MERLYSNVEKCEVVIADPSIESETWHMVGA